MILVVVDLIVIRQDSLGHIVEVLGTKHLGAGDILLLADKSTHETMPEELLQYSLALACLFTASMDDLQPRDFSFNAHTVPA